MTPCWYFLLLPRRGLQAFKASESEDEMESILQLGSWEKWGDRGGFGILGWEMMGGGCFFGKKRPIFVEFGS